MKIFIGFVTSVLSIYSLLLIIRIMLSWFSKPVSSKPVDILMAITDPYLNWWRKTLNLRIGYIDLSPVAAIMALSIVQSILYSILNNERILLGNVLAVILTALWQVTSFIIGIFFIFLILRLIAHLTNRNLYSSFWRVIDTISQPIIFRISNIFFKNKSISYLQSIIYSSVILGLTWLAGGFIISFCSKLLAKLPF